jgi:putative transposase
MSEAGGQRSRPFSRHYVEARARFLEASNSCGATLYELALNTPGPGGEVLTIDIAVLGSERPKRVLVHCSGLHGVEGFAGSAIQLQLLQQDIEPCSGGAVVLVHILNPFGMAGLTARPEKWRWSSARAHLTANDDALVTVAPMPERVADWAAYLGTDNEPQVHQSMQRHIKTGRPLGSNTFLTIAERMTGRSLHRKKPGPKPREVKSI